MTPTINNSTTATKTTAERIRAILVKDYKLDPEHLTLDARLADLGVDSLGMAELMFNIEDEFGLELTSDPTQIATFGDVVHFIDALIADKSAIADKSTPSPMPAHANYATGKSNLGTVTGAPLAP